MFFFVWFFNQAFLLRRHYLQYVLWCSLFYILCYWAFFCRRRIQEFALIYWARSDVLLFCCVLSNSCFYIIYLVFPEGCGAFSKYASAQMKGELTLSSSWVGSLSCFVKTCVHVAVAVGVVQNPFMALFHLILFDHSGTLCACVLATSRCLNAVAMTSTEHESSILCWLFGVLKKKK